MYRARVFNVMLASPIDVATERRMARDVIQEWNSIHSESRRIVLMPVGWETHSSPLLGDRPQAIINDQVLMRSDLLVAIFWTRLGTATGQALSGTVEEIERHVTSGRPAMLYFSSAPVLPQSVDFEQYQALQDFKAAISSRGLFESFESITEFREKFARQLAQVLNTHSYFKRQWAAGEPPIEKQAASSTPPPVPDGDYPPPGDVVPLDVDPLSRLIKKRSDLSSQLSPDAAALLTEGAKDEGGILLRIETFGGLEISTNGKEFVEEKNARHEARWEEALAELLKLGLVRDKSNKGEVFMLTKLGYELADSVEGRG